MAISALRIMGLQHIGIPTANFKETKAFYESLGFVTALTVEHENRDVLFLQNGGLTLEIYEQAPTEQKSGAIDHLTLDVDDIEKAFRFAQAHSFSFVDDEVKFLPFWKNGVKFFTVLGPNGERIEFNQKL